MLKWLRKYNTLILVVGGCLLMVAFLLQGVLSDLSRRGIFGGTAFKIGSHKVTDDNLREAGHDYNAMCALVGGNRVLEATFGIENLDHWYLLVREAQQAGLIGGEQDGTDFLDELPQALASYMASRDMRYSYDTYLTLEKMQLSANKSRAIQEAGLTSEGFYKALAKLRGIERLTSGFVRTLHYGERRLASDGRDLFDTFRADYVMVPAEREIAGIPDPDEAAIKAHYQKYKDTPKGGGEYGIGYLLPPRVKLSWIEINKRIISDAVVVDDIEAEKRFLKQYPNGQVGEGKTAADERKRFENQVREEQAEKAVAAAETVVRDEIFRATRKLERDGEFYRIPAGYEGVDLTRVREEVAKRLLELYKMTIPAPKVVVRSASWITEADVPSLEGIGASTMRHGPNQVGFADVLFSVKEIAGNNDLGLQVGIPSAEPLRDPSGNAYFFVLLDARKESNPDSMDEVRPDIVRNIKRLAAYEKLKADESQLLQTAIASGLDALTRPPAGATDPSPVKTQEVLFNRTQTAAPDQSLDSAAFRTKAMEVASRLDPTVDPATVPNDKKMFSFADDKILAVGVFRIKALQPSTIEKFRAQNSLWVQRVRRKELGTDLENPFSLENMEKRLNVQYDESRQKDRSDRKADKTPAKARNAKR
jgi:hypothetical protein